MISRSVSLTFVLTLVILLGIGGAAQAAPPSPEASLGETFDFDNAGYNLGTVMSGRGQPQATVEPTAEPTGEPTAEPTDEIEDPTEGTVEPPEEAVKLHPVASALADYFGVSYEEVMGLHLEGYGFGNIAKAYFFAQELGWTPDQAAQLLSDAHGHGWGNVLKENGLHPGAVGNGHKPEKKTGKTDDLDGPDQNDDLSGLAGPGSNGQKHGQGHGNGKDHNNGNGNGHGNGKGHHK